MNTCEKCGAYIPIGETACPACGYDPDAERRQEAERRAAAEEARRQAAREAERRRAAEEEARRKAEQEAQRRAEQEARRRARQQTYGGAQAQYAPPRQDYARQGETWTPPWEQRQTAHAPETETFHRGQPKNKWVALALCAFMGPAGIHKFYEGKPGMGLLYMFTGGLFGVGYIYDIISLLNKPETYYVDED